MTAVHGLERTGGRGALTGKCYRFPRPQGEVRCLTLLSQSISFHRAEFRQTVSECEPPQRLHDGAISLSREPDEVALHIGTDEAPMGNDARLPYADRRIMRRCHIHALEIQRIGKEANRWEEQFHLGADPDAQVEYGLSPRDWEQLVTMTRKAIRQCSQRKLATAAQISRNTLSAVVQRKASLPIQTARRLREAVLKLKPYRAESREPRRTRLAADSYLSILRETKC